MAGLEELPFNHEVSHLLKALEYVEDFTCAVDGGAHKGIWTRELVRRFGFVVAFEPVRSNFIFLPNCMAYMAALGDKEGRCKMAPGPENTGQYHVIEGDEVPVVRLDDFGLEPGFIKLDVEGMEYHALLGGEETIRTSHPVIVIEETGLSERYGVKQGQACELLESWGYEQVARCNKNHILRFSSSGRPGRARR